MLRPSFIGHALEASLAAISAIQRHIDMPINMQLQFADKKSGNCSRTKRQLDSFGNP
jgi:hypothetical protein